VPLLQLEVLKQIQTELTGLRGELTGVHAELTTVRTELKAELKAELASVRTELKAEVSHLAEALTLTRQDMHEGFVRLRTELVGLRSDVEVGVTTMRLQNDRRFLDHGGRLLELERQR
jgi:uncharacterized protein YicC (UPF0701 family)